MVRPRPVYLLSVLLFYSVCGVGAVVGKSQITPPDKKSTSRLDHPFTSVSLASQAGDPQSSLFSTCLAMSRTLDATFASIEVTPGSEYIRYVPDSVQLAFPVTWESLEGDYPSIFECVDVAYESKWPMFKYDGVECKVVNAMYSLNDVPKCEDKDSEAVFILSTAESDCPMPRFLVGFDIDDIAVCALVNENPMTFEEAKTFCLNVFPNEELTLFINEYPPVTVQDVIGNFTALGYTSTNLWVGAEGMTAASYFLFNWYGNFDEADWFDGQFPFENDEPSRILLAAYMDKESNYKFKAADKSTKAGALCTTNAITAPIE